MKDIVVLKFGGTSMGSASAILKCVNIVKDKAKTYRPVVVVSAVAGATNTLIQMFTLASNQEKTLLKKELDKFQTLHCNILTGIHMADKLDAAVNQILVTINILSNMLENITSNHHIINDKIYAQVLSYGERLSSILMHSALSAKGLECELLTSDSIIITENSYLEAQHIAIETKNACKKHLSPILTNGIIPVITGFFGSNIDKEVTLLGRGGSDYSASIIASCIDAKKVEIWTDVDGIMSIDPKLDSRAVSILSIDNDIAAEMAIAGAKVLHPRTIQPAQQHDIDVVVLNTFNTNFLGTTVHRHKSEECVVGIVNVKNNTIINIQSVDAINIGFAANIMNIVSDNNIPIDVITTSELSVSFSIREQHYEKVLSSILSKLGFVVKFIYNIAKISIIGYKIAGHSQILANIFNIMNENKIKSYMLSVSASANNITIMVHDDDSHKLASLLHNALVLSRLKK